jgi:hypothetical protein
MIEMQLTINRKIMRKITLTSLIIVMCMSLTYSQKTKQDSTYRKFYVGSSAFIFMNLNTNDPNPPDFVQLNFGYRISPKNVISIEVNTWKYAWPLGIPYGDAKTAPEEKYPGYAREFGIGLVFQRFLWKGAYASIDAGNMFVKYMDENIKHIQNGYMLFMTYRLGYHFQFFKNRFFIEPSISITHWPIRTNVPESFARLENKWSNYFLGEPGLHFGVKF